MYYRLQTFADEARVSAQEQRAASGRRVNTGKSRSARYRGLEGNANNRCPPQGNKAPCKTLVSPSWARSTGNDSIRLHSPEDPPGWTILSLGIPNAHIDREHWDYLGDDEAEIEDPDTTARQE